MDSFKEQLVTRNPDTSTFVKKTTVFVAALFISALLFILFKALSLVLIVLIGYGTYYLIKNFDVEYEYICTNGELDIDKIIAKSRRKRLISAEIQEALEFGEVSGKSFNKDYSVIDATSGSNENDYYLTCKSSKFGMCYVLISPNDEMLNVIKTYLPRNIRS